jgi:hypothetical protein
MHCYDCPVHSELLLNDFLFGVEPVVLILTVFAAAAQIQFIRTHFYPLLRQASIWGRRSLGGRNFGHSCFAYFLLLVSLGTIH